MGTLLLIKAPRYSKCLNRMLHGKSHEMYGVPETLKSNLLKKYTSQVGGDSRDFHRPSKILSGKNRSFDAIFRLAAPWMWRKYLLGMMNMFMKTGNISFGINFRNEITTFNRPYHLGLIFGLRRCSQKNDRVRTRDSCSLSFNTKPTATYEVRPCGALRCQRRYETMESVVRTIYCYFRCGVTWNARVQGQTTML